MQFAHVDEQRIRPEPGLSGYCPCCGQEVISKCGNVKVWHWAHRSKGHCDDWYENETLWHRTWKNQFPESWTEVVQHSNSGEKHIADVKTQDGLVIEFQHSHICTEERLAREAFYRRMIWVVDGKRLKRDKYTFFKHINNKRENQGRPRTIEFNPMVPQITRRWIDSKNLVYLDFGGDDLWCVSTVRGIWQKYVSQITKREFVDACTVGGEPVGVFKKAERGFKLSDYY